MSQTEDPTGRHEPPTKRSFYLSLGTSTLRAALLVVAVILGIILLKKAFPVNASEGVVTSHPAAVPTSPAPSTRPAPSPTRAPRIKGVVVQVLNGAARQGLAAAATQTLMHRGYKVEQPGDAAKTTTTVVYYRADSKIDAQFLQAQYFPDARLKPAPSTFPPTVQITVVLGEDYTPAPTPST